MTTAAPARFNELAQQIFRDFAIAKHVTRETADAIKALSTFAADPCYQTAIRAAIDGAIKIDPLKGRQIAKEMLSLPEIERTVSLYGDLQAVADSNPVLPDTPDFTDPRQFAAYIHAL